MEKINVNLLYPVYKEIVEKLGMEAVLGVHALFKGIQVNFPTRLFDPIEIKKTILDEYDGTNVNQLAIKYEYSERTIRRMIKESDKKMC